MIRRLLDRLFAIDPRSLAAFRVAIGAILLVDLLIRSSSIIEHYSDAGLLQRAAWVEATGDSWRWSLHAMSGLPAFESMLFVIAGLAAAALILGWRTRVAAVVCFILLASLHQRNEMILNGGDALLRVLLFWAMFLPMGGRWSIDALMARRRAAAEAGAQANVIDERNAPVLRVAGVCILLQFLLMYICTGLYKCDEVWTTGDALRRSFSFDMYAKPPGVAMLAHESLLGAISRAVPWVEIILPALCLLPVFTRWCRALAIVVFIALHIGIELTLTTGLFPWVCMAGWLLFVPSAWWDWRGRVWHGQAAALSGLPVADAQGDSPRANGPERPPARATRSLSPRHPLAHLADGVLLFLFAYVVLWNIAGLREKLADEPPLAPTHHWLGQLTTLNQQWNMFADPPLDTGWYVITARNTFGDEINLLTGEKLDAKPPAEKPHAITTHYPDHRWRKLMAEWRGDAKRPHWPKLAHALATRWNRTHDETNQITFIELAFMRERTPAPGEEPTPASKFVMTRMVVGR